MYKTKKHRKKRKMLKILIADDHELFLDGLKFAISDLDTEVNIVTARDYNELMKEFKANPSSFNLILTDLAMPGMTWDTALKIIHSENSEVPIVIISAVYDNETISKAVDLGVSGFIPKTSSNKLIVSAINLVLSGGVYIPHEVLEKKNQEIKDDKEEKVKGKEESILTPRQLGVLKLIAEGKSNKVIAGELDLSEGTVKLHVTAILKALGVTNRTGAVIAANKMNLTKNE